MRSPINMAEQVLVWPSRIHWSGSWAARSWWRVFRIRGQIFLYSCTCLWRRDRRDGRGRTSERSGEQDAFRGRRILMAEDNELNAMIAKEILESMGAAVDVAGDGQKAVDSFASHPVDYYDFILMDVQMPVMDGREASRTIRAMDRPDARSLLIFGLSADAFVEDERLSLESGMNGHYAKPVDYEALRENVGRFLREKA